MRQVLHVGCGAPAPEKLHPAFRDPRWLEIRLDIDPNARPDIVASMTDMAVVKASSMDAVFSAHNLEHLFAHKVPVALREFRRVLHPEGVALITVPDLQSVAALVAEGRLSEAAYVSPMGPISPLDMVYGFGPAIARGNVFMAHRTGFTGQSLLAHLTRAGFALAVAQRCPDSFSLWAIAFAESPTETELEHAKLRMLPLHRAAALSPAHEAAHC